MSTLLKVLTRSLAPRSGRVDQIWSDRIFGSDLKRPNLVGSDLRIGSEMTRSGRIGFRIKSETTISGRIGFRIGLDPIRKPDFGDDIRLNHSHSLTHTFTLSTHTLTFCRISSSGSSRFSSWYMFLQNGQIFTDFKNLTCRR